MARCSSNRLWQPRSASLARVAPPPGSPRRALAPRPCSRLCSKR